jgi:hypothetical protein
MTKALGRGSNLFPILPLSFKTLIKLQALMTVYDKNP